MISQQLQAVDQLRRHARREGDAAQRCAARRISARRSTFWRAQWRASWRSPASTCRTCCSRGSTSGGRSSRCASALGARRGHLVQQALTESLLLAVAGSLIGVPLAIWATRALARLQTFGVPLLAERVGRSDGAGRDDRAHRARRHRLRRAAGAGTSRARSGGAAAPRTSAAPAARRRSRATRSSSSRWRWRACCSSAPGLLIPQLRRPAAGRPRLPAANTPWRGASIRRARSTAWPRPTRTSTASSRSVAALPGVDAVGLSDVLPLGRNRTWGVRAKGVEYPPGQAPIGLPAHRRPALPAGDADSAARRPVLRRPRHRRRREGRHHQRESGARGCGPIVTPSVRSSRRRVARKSSAWSATSGTVRSRKPAATRCICTTGRRATGRGWKWSCAAHGRPNHWCRTSARHSPPTIPACRTASSTSSGG